MRRRPERPARAQICSVVSVVLNASGTYLASSSGDETVHLWDVHTSDCLRILSSERPYERMNITGATGITDAQRATLKALGAVDLSPHIEHLSQFIGARNRSFTPFVLIAS